MTTAPKLVVEWESPIRAFLTSIRPALCPARGPRIPFVPTGIPIHAPSASIVGHCLLFWIVLTFAPRFMTMPVQVIEPHVDEASTAIIYWKPGLPDINDVPGAETGISGKAGGGEFKNTSRVLRISRGRALSTVVSTPPKLTLRISESSLANFISLPGALNPPALEQQPPEQVRRPEIVLSRGTRAQTASNAKAEPPVIRVPVPAAQMEALARQPKLSLPAPPVAPEPMRIATSVADASATPGLIALPLPSSDALEIVLSVSPGTNVGMPSKASEGTFATSPHGQTGGFGGGGRGSGIAAGTGPGSAGAGTGVGPGAGSIGDGHGSQATARGGSSVTVGPGGAGTTGRTGQVVVPGVVIQGGVVYLPSFGSGSRVSTQPQAASTQPPRHPQSIVVVATSRSGGALPAYGLLRGGRVYTIYIDTTVGTVVLQFADPTAQQGFEAEIKPPEPLSTEMDSQLSVSRTIVACAIDRLGRLKDARIIETGIPKLVPQILGALKNWTFRPALRGDQAIDVEAILGFAINTN